MIINVTAKGKINCRRFIRLSAIRLDVNQIKLPATQYHTASRKNIGFTLKRWKWWLPLQKPATIPGSEVNLHTFALFLNFMQSISITLFFNFYCQSSHLSPLFIPILSQSHLSYQHWILMFNSTPFSSSHSQCLYSLPSYFVQLIHLT